MFLESVDTLPGADLPYPYRLVMTPACQEPFIRAECQCRNAVCVSFQSALVCATVHVPKVNFLIIASARNQRPFFIECYCTYSAFMPSKDTKAVSAFRIP